MFLFIKQLQNLNNLNPYLCVVQKIHIYIIQTTPNISTSKFLSYSMATQTCDRVITYRNFDYARAETIIQQEEYLDQEDFDDIRFYRRHGNIIEDIGKAKEKYARHSNEDLFTSLNETHHREKRNNWLTASFSVNTLPILKQNILD